MKKLILGSLIAVVMMFTGCSMDQEKVESGWDKAKTAHAVAKAVGGAAIDSGLVSEETAQKLKTANSIVETTGGAAEDLYTIGTKKPDADMNSAEK